MKLLLLQLLLLLPIGLLAQDRQPTIGTLDDIKGLKKYYVIGSTDERRVTLGELSKWKVGIPVNDPEEAEFFVEYKVLARDETSSPYGLSITNVKGQLDVFVNRGGRKIIAWSDTLVSGRIKNYVVGELTRRLTKTLSKRPDPQ